MEQMQSAEETPAGAAPQAPEAPTARQARARRYRTVINVALVAVLLIGLAVVRPWSRGTPRDAAEDLGSLRLGPQHGYLFDEAELRHRAELGSQGQAPYDAAIRQLLDFADDALQESPKPENPLRSNSPDGQFGIDAGKAYGLGLAYGATGDRRYANKAADFVMSWVSKTRSTKKSCPDSGGCPTSLLVSRHAPGFVFSATLIADAGVLRPDDLEAFRDWLATVILPATSERTNNWGDAGTFARAVVTDYLGDRQGFADAMEHWRTLMDLVSDGGEIPEETRRGDSGMVYTQGALSFKIATAAIAERRGVDLWSYEGRRGGTLKEAVDLLARYWDHPRDWPFHDGASLPNPSPMWEIAYTRWRDPAILPILLEERPFGDDSNSAIRWTTLTSGLPG